MRECLILCRVYTRPSVDVALFLLVVLNWRKLEEAVASNSEEKAERTYGKDSRGSWAVHPWASTLSSLGLCFLSWTQRSSSLLLVTGEDLSDILNAEVLQFSRVWVKRARPGHLGIETPSGRLCHGPWVWELLPDRAAPLWAPWPLPEQASFDARPESKCVKSENLGNDKPAP